MCDPASLLIVGTSAALTIAGAAAITSGVAKQRAAVAQANYQRQLAEARNQQIAANNALVEQAYNNQVNQSNLKQQQEDVQASQKINQANIQTLQAEARARVSAGESGVSGVSVDALMADFERQDAVYRDSVRYNRELNALQSRTDLESVRAQATGRAQAIQPYIPSPVEGNNWWATGLTIAQQNAQAWSGVGLTFGNLGLGTT